MKKLTTLLTLSLFVTFGATAQDKIYEKDLIGNWKMVIDMDGVIEELDEEAEDADNLFAEVIMKSVSGLVEGVMDNIDIYMEFERGGDVVVYVDAFDTDSEEDDAEWYIKGNRLYIEDLDNDNLNWDSDDDDYWVMDDGVLYLENRDDDDEVKIYMIRVDDK